MTSDIACQQSFLAWQKDLLLLLDLLDDANVNLENIGNDISGSQCKPLGKRDISNTVTLVEFDPDKLLGLGSVLNVVA